MRVRSLYEVVVVSTIDDFIVSEEKIIASSEEMVKQKMHFSDEDLEAIEEGTLVVSVREILSYQKPEKIGRSNLFEK